MCIYISLHLYLYLPDVRVSVSTSIVKSDTIVQNQKELIKNEKDSLATLVKQLDGVSKSLKDKEKELNKCNDALVAKENESAEADNSVTTLREKYQNACAGVAGELHLQHITFILTILLNIIYTLYIILRHLLSTIYNDICNNTCNTYV